MKASLLRKALMTYNKLEESWMGEMLTSSPPVEPNIEADDGMIYYWGVPQLLHCNHFNRSHQMFIEDPPYVNSEEILLRSAAESSYRQAKNYLNSLENPTFDDAVQFGKYIFSESGFGTLDFSRIDETGGKLIQPHSHYGEVLKLNPGTREKPGEYFDRGFVAGILLAGSDVSTMEFDEKGLAIEQEKSIVLGDEHNEFTVSVGGDFEWLEMVEPQGSYSYDKEVPPQNNNEAPIDYPTINKRAEAFELDANEQGLINQFNVTVTLGYTDFYMKSLGRFIHAIEEKFGTLDVAANLVREIGHMCAFFLGGNIMQSLEFEVLCGEWLTEPENYIWCFVALLDTLGWGHFRIQEIEPNERFVIDSYNMFEGSGYTTWFGERSDGNNVEWITEGGFGALMDLVYYADIETVDITPETYKEMFDRREKGFSAGNIKTESSGDEFTRTIVELK